MAVKKILNEKGTYAPTILPEALVSDVISALEADDVGALVVSVDGDQINGIISERDLVRHMAKAGAGIMKMKVRDVMTVKVAVCTPEDSIKDAMGIMESRHIRHLPVLENEKLVGIISQRDVMQHRLKETELETNVLRDHVRVIGT